MDMEKPIKETLRDLREHYLAQKRTLNFKLRGLTKGSVSKRKIKGHEYYYLVYRDNGKFTSEYLGKKEPIELIQEIEMRREYAKQLKIVEKALYTLGFGKRATAIPKTKRFAVLERDNFKCQYCGASATDDNVKLNVDHVLSLKNGGSDSVTNLITCCDTCNSSKGASYRQEPYINQVTEVLENLTTHCQAMINTDKWKDELCILINESSDILGNSDKYIY